MRRLPSLTLLVLLAVPVWAEDPTAAEAEPAEPAWEGSLGLSFLATSGNSDTENLGGDFRLDRQPSPWGLSLVASFTRAEQDGARTAERYYAGIRGKRHLDERWELFAGVSGEQDEFAAIDLRRLVETGAIYRALLGPVHSLSFDLGLTWTDENRFEPAPDVSFLGAVVGLSYEWSCGERATVSERLVYYPNLEVSEDWRLESVTSLIVSLSSRFALQLAYEVRHRNLPIDDKDDTDTTTKVSLVTKF